MLNFLKRFFPGNPEKREDGSLSLETMEKLASIFGFKRATAGFDRWVSPAGCLFRDVGSALSGSDFILTADWRDDILDVVKDIKRALRYWKLKVSVEPDPDNIGIAYMTINDEKIELAHQLDEDWLDLFVEVQKHLPATIEIRQSVGNSGSDTSEYILLLGEEWTELEAIAGDYFKPRYERLIQPL